MTYNLQQSPSEFGKLSKKGDFSRFFYEILCEYEPPEDFEKMTEMLGNPPKTVKITIFGILHSVLPV